MNNNDTSTASNTAQTLSPLLSETERTAVRSLLYDAGEAPIINQSDTLDAIFHVISHPARRYVLTYLLRVEGYVTMGEIVDYVINSTDSGTDPQELRREVTVSLTHTHLPMLEDEGFIQYNMERQLIHPTAKTELAGPYLKLALVHRDQTQNPADQ